MVNETIAATGEGCAVGGERVRADGGHELGCNRLAKGGGGQAGCGFVGDEHPRPYRLVGTDPSDA
ncbi:MAG: hypothetical protein ACREOS_09075 [Candidatus Dormibacteraceae bacterium]